MNYNQLPILYGKKIFKFKYHVKQIININLINLHSLEKKYLRIFTILNTYIVKG